jgi:hypothetical protein
MKITEWFYIITASILSCTIFSLVVICPFWNEFDNFTYFANIHEILRISFCELSNFGCVCLIIAIFQSNLKVISPDFYRLWGKVPFFKILKEIEIHMYKYLSLDSNIDLITKITK